MAQLVRDREHVLVRVAEGVGGDGGILGRLGALGLTHLLGELAHLGGARVVLVLVGERAGRHGQLGRDRLWRRLLALGDDLMAFDLRERSSRGSSGVLMGC